MLWFFSVAVTQLWRLLQLALGERAETTVVLIGQGGSSTNGTDSAASGTNTVHAPAPVTFYAVVAAAAMVSRRESPLLLAEPSAATVAGGVAATPTEAAFASFMASSNPREMANAGKVQVEGSITGRGVLPVSLQHLDDFLSMRCSVSLLSLGLFPNAQEITESMACMSAARAHLPESFGFDNEDVTCVVVGDGRRPRTAALMCFRTKWRRIISLDPDQRRHPGDGLDSIARLELEPVRIQDVIVDIDAVRDRSVLIILPHAHVPPNMAIASLRVTFGSDGGGGGSSDVQIAVIQMPCCGYEYHDRCVGLDPDIVYTDDAVGSSRRVIKVWKDVSAAALKHRGVHIGDSKPRVRLMYPDSCSVDRRGWRKAARAAREGQNGGSQEDPTKSNGTHGAPTSPPVFWSTLHLNLNARRGVFREGCDLGREGFDLLNLMGLASPHFTLTCAQMPSSGGSRRGAKRAAKKERRRRLRGEEQQRRALHLQCGTRAGGRASEPSIIERRVARCVPYLDRIANELVEVKERLRKAAARLNHLAAQE
jgi:hypothetical protein